MDLKAKIKEYLPYVIIIIVIVLIRKIINFIKKLFIRNSNEIEKNGNDI